MYFSSSGLPLPEAAEIHAKARTFDSMLGVARRRTTRPVDLGRPRPEELRRSPRPIALYRVEGPLT